MEFIAGDEKRFAEFISNLNEKDKIAILSHNDMDGLTSAVIVSKVLGKIDYIHFVGYSFGEFQRVLEEVKKRKINKIVFTDLAIDNIEVNIKEFEKISSILAIDHHPMHQDLNSDKTIFIKADSDFPASYLCYYLFSKIQKIPSWIPAIGIISDCPHKYNAKNSDKAFNDFNLEKENMNLFDAVSRANLALIYFKDNEEKFYDVLMNAKNPDDLRVLDKFAAEVKKEFDFLIDDFEKNHEKHGKLKIYSLNPKYNLASSLINKISCKHINNSIIFISLRGDYMGISARRQDKKISMPELLKKSLEGIPESTSGGHVAAAGAEVPIKYLTKFKENLIRVHKEIANFSS